MSSHADDFDIEHPAEVAALLQEMLDDQVRLHLSAGAEQELALQPLRLDRHHLVLRWHAIEGGHLPAWLAQGAVHAHATLDRIRLDFELEARELRAEVVPPELWLTLPMRLRRHQRRQAFRVQPPSQHYPRAALRAPGGAAALPLSLLNLSAGGLAVRWPRLWPLPEPGNEVEGLELELARQQLLRVKVSVEHVLMQPEGPVVGLSFVALPPMAERQIQQHLNEAQRRARTLGAR